MTFPRSRIPEDQDVLFPAQKAAVQQRPELPGRFRRQPLQIEIRKRLLQRQRRIFEEPLDPGFPPLLAFPRDYLEQVLLIAQRLAFRTPRRVFIALPHRRQVQILEVSDQSRTDIRDRAHWRTPISVHNWSKLARSTGATTTIVTSGSVPSLASTSPIASTVITASASSSSRRAASTGTSPASAASFRILRYSLLDRPGAVSFSASYAMRNRLVGNRSS